MVIYTVGVSITFFALLFSGLEQLDEPLFISVPIFFIIALAWPILVLLVLFSLIRR